MSTLTHWTTDSDLAGIRDENELTKLPAEQQEAFKQFWVDVAELLKKPRS